MNTFTYSMADLAGAIAHPDLGAYTFTGEGVGSISITYEGENTSHDVAADGSVMVSMHLRKNGRITINCQQTSYVHKWILAAFNALYGNASAWAEMGATLRSVGDGTSHILAGMSHLKIADKNYQAQGQMVAWVFMFANGESVTT